MDQGRPPVGSAVDGPSPVLERWSRTAATDRPAVIDAAGTHSHASLDERARRVAGALLAKGTTESGRVGIFIEAGSDWVATFFGVLRAGRCAVVLSPMHPEAESAYFCDDGEVETILASPTLAPRLDAIARGRRLITTDALARETPATDLPHVGASDAALQLYTSGTTGKPKGAVLTHRNLGVQQHAIAKAWGHSPNDVLVHALPLHHLHGLAISLLNLIGAGGCSRMLPQFDAEAIWNAMGEATLFMGVPTMYSKLLSAFDAANDATRARWGANARGLRLATSGSAALPVTIGERWRAITGTYPLERFGMTEIGIGLSNPLAGPRKPGMVGLPVESAEVRIVGDDGHPAPSGELWIRGPSVFSGYWRRADATSKAFAEDDAGGERWFKTGDTVTRDDEGWFKILGRTSVDILKSGGYKLSALEIEEVLRGHDSVAEVAVVGLPDETWGERVVACVVPREGHVCDEGTLRGFAKERLASYKVPKEVVTMRELPRNAMGKVQKPELVKTLRAARGVTS